MKFSGICLITEDVSALAGFYERIFNCQAEGDQAHAEIKIGGVEITIFSKAGMERLAPGSMEHAGYGSFTMGFAVDDVDAEYKRLSALGVEIVKNPTTHPWGCRSLWFRDPDGNLIDFICRA